MRCIYTGILKASELSIKQSGASDLKGKLDVNKLTGYSYQDFMNSTTTVTKDEAETKTLNDSPYKTQNTLVSFFGRANLNVQDRYLLTFTLRRDGSSYAFGQRKSLGNLPVGGMLLGKSAKWIS